MTLPVLEDMAEEEYQRQQRRMNRTVDRDELAGSCGEDDDDNDNLLEEDVPVEVDNDDGSARRTEVYKDDKRPRRWLSAGVGRPAPPSLTSRHRPPLVFSSTSAVQPVWPCHLCVSSIIASMQSTAITTQKTQIYAVERVVDVVCRSAGCWL